MISILQMKKVMHGRFSNRLHSIENLNTGSLTAQPLFSPIASHSTLDASEVFVNWEKIKRQRERVIEINFAHFAFEIFIGYPGGSIWLKD